MKAAVLEYEFDIEFFYEMISMCHRLHADLEECLPRSGSKEEEEITQCIESARSFVERFLPGRCGTHIISRSEDVECMLGYLDFIKGQYERFIKRYCGIFDCV
jgi:hypothetical protein